VIFFKILSRLPFWILYLISDFIAFTANHIVQYRKKVVLDNLYHAFPEKNDQEIRKIANQFYINFADTIVETIKALTISKEEIIRRVASDTDELVSIQKEGFSIFLMAPHIFNWEWFALRSGISFTSPIYGIYQKLNNKFFDRLMYVIRSRFGATPIERGEVLRHAIRSREELIVYGTLADLRPIDAENKLWIKFMNRDAAFYKGTEKLARKLKYAVVYLKLKKVKRGYYKMKFIRIDVPPFTSKPYEITEKFVKLVEKDIERDPANYLWSHKRWKHTPPLN